MPSPSEEAAIGSIHAVKSLFNHSNKAQSPFARWSESKDPAVEERRLKELGQSHAIVHRFSRYETTTKGDYAWKTYSVEIKSPRLRAILSRVFRDYAGWNPDSNPYTFYPPFKPLAHRWDRILESSRTEPDKDTKIELQLFRRELDPLLASHFSALNEAKSTGVISFENLWLILAPGDVMLSYDNGSVCASRLREAKLVSNFDGSPFWALTMDRIDWNGSNCGFQPVRTRIEEFTEPILATRLCVYPLDFAPNRQEIRDTLLARGRKFESLRGFHVQTCTGNKIMGEPREHLKPFSGRVIVDAYAYYICQEKTPPAFLQDAEAALLSRPDGSESDKEPIENDSKQKERHEQLQPLTDIECILANPRVKGFDLKTKEWCEFYIDEVHAPDWNDRPWEKLVLPPGEKELIVAFAARHKSSETKFDDFVQHKGEGIIILLCGPPGVGKTLTAEAVAEKSKAPLYILSAADLGTTPSKVEYALNRALECCALWNAVLLLDEADVFLESRDSNSLERNELVSIFLRRLEYYQGLLFLTTNRISVIDPAFQSRIDLIIPYDDLDSVARRQVWVNFISLLPPEATEFGADDCDKLAKFQMNGRQIKNTIKTALVLAAHDKPLKMRHLEVVLNIRKRVADIEMNGQRPMKRPRFE